MNELQRYLVEEAVEDYEEGRLTRREALKAIAGITGAALAAQMLEARAQAAPAGKASASSAPLVAPDDPSRSEEHTSELQSQSNLVCRLLLEKKKNKE